MVCGIDLVVRFLVEDRVCFFIFFFKRVYKWNNVFNRVSDSVARVRSYKTKRKFGEEGINITWIGLLSCIWGGLVYKDFYNGVRYLVVKGGEWFVSGLLSLRV